MDWPALVREVLEEARTAAGSAPTLARQLEQAGVHPEGGRYADSSISNWIKGRTSPSGDIVLAAAAVAGISLDQKIARLVAGKPTRDEDATTLELERLRGDLERLRGQTEQADESIRHDVDRLETLLMDLYARIGEPYPDEQVDDEPPERRAVGT